MNGKPGMASCPCGSGHTYGSCCGRYHAGASVPDAQALMRARYSAYAVGDIDYLLASWHPGTRPERSALKNPSGARVTWLGLSIESHQVIGDASAEVIFCARYCVGRNRAVQRMREHSRFVREAGVWFYLDAVEY